MRTGHKAQVRGNINDGHTLEQIALATERHLDTSFIDSEVEARMANYESQRKLGEVAVRRLVEDVLYEETRVLTNLLSTRRFMRWAAWGRVEEKKKNQSSSDLPLLPK